MDWQTLAWEPLDGPLAAAAGPLVDLSEILRGAVEESSSALAQAPITVADASVARVPAFASVSMDVEPVVTFELMAAARRQVLVGIDPKAGLTLAGAAVVPVILARAIAEGVDGAFSDMLGEGLNLGPSDGASIPGAAQVLVLRLKLRGSDGSGVDLLSVVEEQVPAELAGHVVALRALGTVDLPMPVASAASGAQPVAAGGSPDDLQAAADAAFAALAAVPTAPMAPSGHAAAPGHAAAAGNASHASSAAAMPAGPAIRQATFDELSPRTPDRPTTSLDLLLGVNLQVTVEIGRTRLQIREILGLAPGSIVELDKLAGEPVDVLVNGRQIATGEVVVVDENFGVRITEIVSRQRRIAAGAAPAA